MTNREHLVKVLKSRAMTARDMATALSRRIGDVLDDLEHVRRSEKVEIEPARCSKCEFTFRKRTKLGTPSRCPKCKSERIEGPWLSIKG